MKINHHSLVGMNSSYPLQTKNTGTTNQKTPSYSASGLSHLAVYNRASVNFKGYYGDKQPAKKLFWILTGRNNICKDNETEQNTYHTSCGRNWVTINPEDLLKRTPEQAIQSICTLNHHYEIPSYIL